MFVITHTTACETVINMKTHGHMDKRSGIRDTMEMSPFPGIFAPTGALKLGEQ